MKASAKTTKDTCENINKSNFFRINHFALSQDSCLGGCEPSILS